MIPSLLLSLAFFGFWSISVLGRPSGCSCGIDFFTVTFIAPIGAADNSATGTLYGIPSNVTDPSYMYLMPVFPQQYTIKCVDFTVSITPTIGAPAFQTFSEADLVPGQRLFYPNGVSPPIRTEISHFQEIAILSPGQKFFFSKANAYGSFDTLKIGGRITYSPSIFMNDVIVAEIYTSANSSVITSSLVNGFADAAGVITPGFITCISNFTVTVSTRVLTVFGRGDVIPFNVTIFNTGETNLTGFVLSSSVAEQIACFPVPSNGTLSVGSAINCTGAHVVTQAEMNSGANILINVTVFFLQPGAKYDAATVRVSQNSNVSLVGTVTPLSGAVLSSRVSFSVTIMNTGNVDLFNFSLSNSLSVSMGLCEGLKGSIFLVGASVLCVGDYIVTQDDMNAGAVLSNDFLVSSGSVVSRLPLRASLNRMFDFSVVLLSNVTYSTKLTEMVEYYVEISNTGNVDLIGMAISTSFLGSSSAISCIPVGNGGNLTVGSRTVCRGSDSTPSAARNTTFFLNQSAMIWFFGNGTVPKNASVVIFLPVFESKTLAVITSASLLGLLGLLGVLYLILAIYFYKKKTKMLHRIRAVESVEDASGEPNVMQQEVAASEDVGLVQVRGPKEPAPAPSGPNEPLAQKKRRKVKVKKKKRKAKGTKKLSQGMTIVPPPILPDMVLEGEMRI